MKSRYLRFRLVTPYREPRVVLPSSRAILIMYENVKEPRW